MITPEAAALWLLCAIGAGTVGFGIGFGVWGFTSMGLGLGLWGEGCGDEKDIG